jgi:DNA invertase Pin-like site-specific DNA recombinase
MASAMCWEITVGAASKSAIVRATFNIFFQMVQFYNYLCRKNNVEKAVIYVRVSTKEQNSDRQILDLKKYSNELGLEIVKIFSDSISGYKKGFDDRENFNLMIDYINQNKINHVLVSELSRISRQYIQTVIFIEDCSKKKINIHIHKEKLSTLNEDGTVNYLAQMMVGLLSSIATQESETLGYRIKSGKQSEVLKGKSYHGMLYAYDKKDGYPIINEEKAIVVRKMYDMLLQGLGCRKIANYLNENYKDQRKWSSASVHSIVTNPFYKGHRRYLNLIIPAPPILSEDVFDRAQAFIKDRFRFVSEAKYINPFASFIFCKCKATFIQTINNKKRTDLYKCSSSCGVKSVNRSYLISEIKDWLEHTAKISKDKQERAKFNTQIKANNATIEINKARISQLQKMSRKNYDLFTAEQIEESQFDEALSRYNGEILKLNDNNSKLIEANNSIHIALENEISHYSDNLEIFKSQILPIMESIIIDEKYCTVNLKGYSLFYFKIYRLTFEGIDDNLQELIDNHLDPY